MRPMEVTITRERIPITSVVFLLNTILIHSNDRRPYHYPYCQSMRLLIAIIISIASIGCIPDRDVSFSDPMIISSGAPSGGAYFTHDHLGNPVLCWTEGEDGQARLFFSVFRRSDG